MYQVALFVHMLGIITLFIAFGILQRSGLRLRRATSRQEAVQWLEFLQPVARMLPSAVAMLLLSGIYMMNQAWTLETPWIAVGLAALLAIAVGSVVLMRRLRSLHEHLAGDPHTRTISDTGPGVLDPVLWAVATGLNALAMALVLIMSIKPGWTISICIVLLATLAGAAAGPIVAEVTGRRARQTATGGILT